LFKIDCRTSLTHLRCRPLCLGFCTAAHTFFCSQDAFVELHCFSGTKKGHEKQTGGCHCSAVRLSAPNHPLRIVDAASHASFVGISLIQPLSHTASLALPQHVGGGLHAAGLGRDPGMSRASSAVCQGLPPAGQWTDIEDWISAELPAERRHQPDGSEHLRYLPPHLHLQIPPPPAHPSRENLVTVAWLCARVICDIAGGR
jgi:hypothetical protein